MARTSSNPSKIAATVGVVIVGLAAGPVAAMLMMTYLQSSGSLESEWAFGYLFTHILPSFAVGAIVGCCVAVHLVRRIWRRSGGPSAD